MFKKKNTGFTIVSVIIVLTNVIFVVLNYYSSLSTFEDDICEWAIRTEKFFRITFDDKALAMQKLATFIANDPRVANLFKQGKEAVISEGGGPGKESSALFRKRLYDLLYPGWMEMTKKYDVRQLQFHLGPGSTSFLRIHRPEKFGDNMDEVRFTVVDVNKTLSSTKGFETGRVYSGIRGVSPVFYENADTGLKEHIGAIEAGTSFTTLIESLRENLDCEIAVLLTREHVHRNMWKDFVTDHFDSDLCIWDYYIEASTGQELRALVQDETAWQNLQSNGYAFINRGNPFQICAFPLRDYRGTKDKSLADSGMIIMVKDASQRWEMLKNNLKNNIIYALIALLLVEIILYLAWQYSRTKLTEIIEDQTAEINSHYERLKNLIESFPIGVLILDAESEIIIQANLKFAEMTGLEIADIEGSGKNEFITASEIREEPEDVYLLRNSAGDQKYIITREVQIELQEKRVSIISLTDITHQRQVELERIKKEKLEGVLEMAGAVCHEFNQPLMIISGYAELMLGESSKEKNENGYAKQIKTQTDRLGAITKKLMNITDYETKGYLSGKIIDIDKAAEKRD